MGKIKIKTLGSEEEEKEQKEALKRKREQKLLRKEAILPSEKTDKAEKKANKTPELEMAPVVDVEVEVEKPKKNKKIIVKNKVRGKNYLTNKALIASDKKYSIETAIALLKKFKNSNFDESVELHLNVAESGLKGEINLPHGTGKTVRVAVVDDALLAKLESNIIDFDVLIATPSTMPSLVKFARMLGPKGLMPNPKQGTVTENTEVAVAKFSQGLLQYKTESKFPLIHLTVGKKSFSDSNLIENIKSLVTSIGRNKINAIHISSTMSPSIEIILD